MDSVDVAKNECIATLKKNARAKSIPEVAAASLLFRVSTSAYPIMNPRESIPATTCDSFSDSSIGFDQHNGFTLKHLKRDFLFESLMEPTKIVTKSMTLPPLVVEGHIDKGYDVVTCTG